MANSAQPPAGARAAPRNLRTTFALLALVALAGVALRYRLLGMPLDRDEGGYAYMARLLLDGVPPYTQAYDYKPPGVQILYALFISGPGGGPEAVHAGLLLASVASAALLWFIVRPRAGPAGAAVSAFLLEVFLTSPSVLGFAANATHFVILFALSGILLLERYLARGGWMRAVAAGASFGCAVLMKQAGIVFLLYGLLLPFATRKERERPAGGFLAAGGLQILGFLLPLAAVAAWFSAAGAMKSFLFWNVTYPAMLAEGARSVGLFTRLVESGLRAAGMFLPAWLAALAGALGLILTGRDPGTRARIGLLLGLSSIGLFAGYVIRSHYFILILPALSAGAGIAAARFGAALRAGLPRLALYAAPCLLAAAGVAASPGYYFTQDLAAVSRSIYDPNQFEDMAAVAGFIGSATAKDDRVAVLGSEPEIFYLADRRSASRFIYTYVFNENNGIRERLQEEMIREIDSTAPPVIVLIRQPFSWGALPRADWPILKWAKGYLEESYVEAATVTRIAGGPSVFRRSDDAPSGGAPGDAAIVIYRRAGGGRVPPPPR